MNEIDDMSITINTVAYSQDSFVTPNKVRYTSPTNSFTNRDELSLARTAPKATADFAGVARAEVKRVKTVETGPLTRADAIITLSCSLPVGMSHDDVTALLNDVGDFALMAECDALFWKHDLTA